MYRYSWLAVVLNMLDLSSAFDIVNHSILLERCVYRHFGRHLWDSSKMDKSILQDGTFSVHFCKHFIQFHKRSILGPIVYVPAGIHLLTP